MCCCFDLVRAARETESKESDRSAVLAIPRVRRGEDKTNHESKILYIHTCAIRVSLTEAAENQSLFLVLVSLSGGQGSFVRVRRRGEYAGAFVAAVVMMICGHVGEIFYFLPGMLHDDLLSRCERCERFERFEMQRFRARSEVKRGETNAVKILDDE